MMKPSEMRQFTSPSFSRRFESPVKKQIFRASPFGRRSVSELVVRYQNIFDVEKASSADENPKSFKSRGRKKLQKMELSGTNSGIIPLQSCDCRIPRSKSVQDLVHSWASPTALSAKSVSQASFDSGKALSSPSVGEWQSEACFPEDCQRGSIETNKMGAVRGPNPRLKLETDDSGHWLSSKRGREQGSHVPHLRENDLLRKEAQLMRRSKAAPLMLPASAYTSRKVSSDEKTVRVLGDSDNRRHKPDQGHQILAFPLVKQHSVLYSSRAAAAADHTSGLTELNFIHKTSSNSPGNQKANKAGAKEECAVCSQPVYMMERMTIQNIPLHQACFCCHHCGRKLSLLNYAISSGEFYCKVHSKVVSGVKARNQEENTAHVLKHHQQKEAVLENPGLIPKNGNNQVGKILGREKIQPSLSLSYPEGGRTKSQGNETASRSQPKTTWPPLNKATGGTTWSSGRTKKLPPDTRVILHSWNKVERSSHKALEAKRIGDKSAQVENKQLPRFPKRGEDVLHQIRRLDGNRNLDMSEKRQLVMAKNIHGDQMRKEGQSISEKAKKFQHNPLRLKEKVPMVPPLISVATKLSSFGQFLSYSESLRSTKGAHLASVDIAIANGSSLTGAPLDGKFSSSSSNKAKQDDGSDEKQVVRRAGPLPDTRRSLPVMALPENRQKLPETNQGNTVRNSELEEDNTLSHNSIEPKEGHSQMKPEASGGLLECKNGQRLPSSPDSLNICFTDQGSQQALSGRNEEAKIFYSESLERTGNQLYPGTHCEEANVNKEKEKRTGRISESTEILNCLSDEASLATKPERKNVCSAAAEVELVGARSGSCSERGSPGNTSIFTRNDLQDIHPPCNAPPTTYENPEAMRIAGTNGELQRNVCSGNNIQTKLHQDVSGGAIFQVFLPPAKEPKTSNSCEIPYLTEYQVTDVTVDMRPLADGGSSVQTACSNTTTDDSARKQPLKKETRPFPGIFASQMQGSTPKEPPTTKTKKRPKTRSALATLFGYSSDKEKNEKQQPKKAPSQPSVEACDDSPPQAVCSSNLANPGTSKKAEVPEIRTPVTKSEAALQDSEDGKNSKDGQRGSFPSSDSDKALRVDAFPTELGTDFSSSIFPGTTDNEDPKPSDWKMEPPLRNHTESSLSDDVWNNPTAQGETLLPSKSSVGITSKLNSSVGISSNINDASRGELYGQGFENFPSVEGCDVELKAGNVSLLSPSGENDILLLDQDHQTLCSVGAEKSQEGDSQHDLHLGTEGPTGEELCPGLSFLENPLQINEPCQLLEFGPPTLIRNDCLNKDSPLPDTGNSLWFQHSDPQFCLPFSMGNIYGLGLHGEQATTVRYPTGEDDSPSLPASLQQIPELLRDTIQSKAENRGVAMGRPQEDPLLAKESILHLP